MQALNSIRWIGTTQCAFALGIHPLTLLQKRADGYFEKGLHYYQTGTSKTCKYLWNLEEVEKVFSYINTPEYKWIINELKVNDRLTSKVRDLPVVFLPKVLSERQMTYISSKVTDEE